MATPSLIVIGGSAGALDPLLEIVRGLPATVTAPVVIVLHLHPQSPSLMPTLLQQACPGRVAREAEDKAPLRAGSVHVAPPGYHLLVERTATLALIAVAGGAAVIQADAQYPYMTDTAHQLVPGAEVLAAGDIAAHLARLVGHAEGGARP